MITKVKAYSAWNSAPTLLLDEDGRAETDLIQIRNIDGLDPVKASVNTSPLGSVDGVFHVGSNIPSRNIVFTFHPNPDWDTWSYEGLRKLIYQYFMPKLATRLIFESDDLDPVEIWGIVESVENNIFSKDPEIMVSVICPDPYFRAVSPTVITGQAVLDGGSATTIDYEGNVQTGINVKVTWVSGAVPGFIGLRVAPDHASYLLTDTSVDADNYFEMSSIPMKKFIQNVNLDSGIIESLLFKAQLEEGMDWPHLHPGENDFSVITDQGVQDWELTYYALYGGL